MRPAIVSIQITPLPVLADGIKVFISYCDEDEALKQQLERHLSPLMRQGVISIWHRGKVEAGGKWEQQVTSHIHSANVILILISSDYLASDDCYQEMLLSIERHQTGQARVLPILLRPVYLGRRCPLEPLQVLPIEPITLSQNQDEAFVGIIHRIVDELT
jgi:hypothetical protein